MPSRFAYGSSQFFFFIFFLTYYTISKGAKYPYRGVGRAIALLELLEPLESIDIQPHALHPLVPLATKPPTRPLDLLTHHGYNYTMPHPGAIHLTKGYSMRKTVGKGTQLWQMYEAVLMPKKAGDADETLGEMSRGKAINLAMGLNVCQAQWQYENGVPNSAIMYSAKAKQVPGADAWTVEISRNHTKQGRSKPNELFERILAERQAVVQIPQIVDTQAYVDMLMRGAPTGKSDAFELQLAQSLAQANLPHAPAEDAEEIALRAAKAEQHRYITSMNENSSWVCPSCEMPTRGIAFSRVVQDASGFPSRICGDCVAKLKEKAQ